MKKVMPILGTVIFIVIVAVIFVSMAEKEQPVTIVKGNTAFKPLPIKLNRTNDTQCKMLIKSERNAAEVIAPDGRTTVRTYSDGLLEKTEIFDNQGIVVFHFRRGNHHLLLLLLLPQRGLKIRSRAKPSNAKPKPVTINSTEGSKIQ